MNRFVFVKQLEEYKHGIYIFLFGLWLWLSLSFLIMFWPPFDSSVDIPPLKVSPWTEFLMAVIHPSLWAVNAADVPWVVRLYGRSKVVFAICS